MAGNQSAKDGERKVSIESRIRAALVTLGYISRYLRRRGDILWFNHHTLPDQIFFGQNRPQPPNGRLIQAQFFWLQMDFNSG